MTVTLNNFSSPPVLQTSQAGPSKRAASPELDKAESSKGTEQSSLLGKFADYSSSCRPEQLAERYKSLFGNNPAEAKELLDESAGKMVELLTAEPQMQLVPYMPAGHSLCARLSPQARLEMQEKLEKLQTASQRHMEPEEGVWFDANEGLEPEVEAESHAEPKMEAKLESHADSEAEVELESDAEYESDVELESHAKPEEEMYFESDAEYESDVEPASHAEHEEEVGLESHAKPEEEAHLESHTESKENVKLESNAEHGAEATIQKLQDKIKKLQEELEKLQNKFDKTQAECDGPEMTPDEPGKKPNGPREQAAALKKEIEEAENFKQQIFELKKQYEQKDLINKIILKMYEKAASYIQ